jgi:hypothetical protein
MLLTKKEVCKLFRCSERTFDRWRSLWKAKGVDIGEIKIRGTLRFKSDIIERILRDKKLWLK